MIAQSCSELKINSQLPIPLSSWDSKILIRLILIDSELILRFRCLELEFIYSINIHCTSMLCQTLFWVIQHCTKQAKTLLSWSLCSTAGKKITNKYIGKFIICWMVINAMKTNEAGLLEREEVGSLRRGTDIYMYFRQYFTEKMTLEQRPKNNKGTRPVEGAEHSK